MYRDTDSARREQRRAHPRRPFDWTILILVLAFVAVFHRTAMEGRFLLILYFISLVCAAYALVRRRAFVLAVLIVCVAGTVLLANVYFRTVTEVWNPLLDPVRDVTAFVILLFLIGTLLFEAYRFQKEDRERTFQQLLDEKTVAMRAAALQSTSHEVRTPLSTIIAINETLLSESAGPLAEIQREFLQDMDEASRHLMDLVNDILDFAKAEAGMIKISPEPVALVELVHQCMSMVEPKAAAGGIEVTAYLAPEVTEIFADPLRLKQVLLNLLSNAVKFTQPGGLVKVSVRSDDEDVLIAVRDTGRGIPAEQLEHLFDPYYQAVHSDQGIGTGLGLSIIKHLTKLHGGSVAVSSAPEAGSVFTIRLPRRAAVKWASTESMVAEHRGRLDDDALLHPGEAQMQVSG
jgi:signal transduction histidine kinase